MPDFLRTELPYRADSAPLFEAVADLPWAVFLDSGLHHLTQSRYDVIAAEPHTTLVTRGKMTEIRSDELELSREDPLTLLRRHLACDPGCACDLPFPGGAIGYLGYDGNMDTSIAIRTLVYSGGAIRFAVGGGIVADSRLEDEYQETFDKAAAMLRLLQQTAARQVGG